MKQELVSYFLQEGFLLSPDITKEITDDFDEKSFLELVNKKIVSKEKPTVLNKDLFQIIKNAQGTLEVNWAEFDRSRALFERGRDDKVYITFLDLLNYNTSEQKKKELDKLLEGIKKPDKENFVEKETSDKLLNVVVLKSYSEEPEKREVKDFVAYFNVRYNFMKLILQNRPDLHNVVSINKLSSKNLREPVSLIGLISERGTTKNGNLILTLEDPTGSIEVLFNKEREGFNIAKDCVLDEVVGISGVSGGNIIFANNLFFPDIPSVKELKKSPDDLSAAFIGDFHIGSKLFLAKEFMSFIDWLNGASGNLKQKKIAKQIKYLFVLGDMVDGIGIYPEQDKELNIKDIQQQYELCADYLKKIRKDIHIIICPGNHDALRISEPQPVLDKKFAKSIYELPNVTLVSNPATVNIHSSKDFLGFNVLLYHGYSYDYYGDNVESIRLKRPNISERVDLIMKFLLQRRHLAPSHTSTLYIPCRDKDPLIIDKIPDLFVSGHIHRASMGSYNNVSLICTSCWQAKTPFQEKVGHSPEPCRVPVINLKTRDISILKFGS